MQSFENLTRTKRRRVMRKDWKGRRIAGGMVVGEADCHTQGLKLSDSYDSIGFGYSWLSMHRPSHHWSTQWHHAEYIDGRGSDMCLDVYCLWGL